MSAQCVKIKPDNEVDELLYKTFTNNLRKGWIQIGEDKICMPECYERIADDVENFEVKDSDIYLTSHPKTGTTWAQEMLWMIVNNLDFERAKEDIHTRVPFIEYEGLLDLNNIDANSVPSYMLNSLELTRNYPTTPRMIKTHMPLGLLPKQIRNKTRKPKIIHVMRNAKDTCVSYYYHCCLLEGYKHGLENFCKLFIAGRLSWGPFWTNILSYWKNQQEYDILIIKYEDMKKDLKSVIKKVAAYLNYTLTEEQISQLEDHLSFEKMKNNRFVNLEDLTSKLKILQNSDGNFMRSGTVGSYKEALNEDMIKRIDEWTKKETAGTGLNYDI